MEEFILNNFDRYGPLAVFLLLMLTGIGVPLGEDLVVIPAGVFVQKGDMGFWPTVVAAYAGVFLSDCLWYGVCYRYGTRLLHRRFFKRAVHPRRLLEAKHLLDARRCGVCRLLVSSDLSRRRGGGGAIGKGLGRSIPCVTGVARLQRTRGHEDRHGHRGW